MAVTMDRRSDDPAFIERACEVLHDAYERAAAAAGWQTQAASRVEWPRVPPANQQTMRVAVRALIDFLDREG
jgi:hypothetical protein